MTGRAEAKNFSSYHQILNRARWDPHAMTRRLLVMIVDRLVPVGPVVIGMDDTIERRWGRKITARGIYRDPVRSSHGHFVKASGLRWLSFMVLTPVPWAGVVKALPVLTLLAPSERSDYQRGRRHKLLTDWARQGILQLCRWLPGRDIVFVGDSSFAVHELAHAIAGRETLISRLRLDANLFASPARRNANLARIKGFRFPRSVIGYAVWAYHRFALSFRDVEDLLAERGITVSYETIRDWVGRFGHQFAAKIRRDRPAPADKWHLDEVVVRIKGPIHWLWRAVDANGDVLDILVQSSRDKAVALRFLRKLFKRRGRPRVMVTDKLRYYRAAKAEIAPWLEHRQHKGLNNRGEASHSNTRRREKLWAGSNPRAKHSASYPCTTRPPASSAQNATARTPNPIAIRDPMPSPFGQTMPSS